MSSISVGCGRGGTGVVVGGARGQCVGAVAAATVVAIAANGFGACHFCESLDFVVVLLLNGSQQRLLCTVRCEVPETISPTHSKYSTYCTYYGMYSNYSAHAVLTVEEYSNTTTTYILLLCTHQH